MTASIRRMTWAIVLLSLLVAASTSVPLVDTSGPGPATHVSVRGEEVVTYGYGPYRHMPGDVAVQGLAQDDDRRMKWVGTAIRLRAKRTPSRSFAQCSTCIRDEPVRWRRTRTLLKTTSGKFVARDGAFPGRTQPRGMTLVIKIRHGTYAVAVADYEPDAETQIQLFRLTRRAGTGT